MSAKFPRGGGGSRTFFSSKSKGNPFILRYLLFNTYTLNRSYKWPLFNFIFRLSSNDCPRQVSNPLLILLDGRECFEMNKTKPLIYNTIYILS